MKSEIYISVDIEAAGPIPGEYSLLSIGACLTNDIDQSFYIELHPINGRFVQRALDISGLSLQYLRQNGKSPLEAMTLFRDWLRKISTGSKPVFVGFNASFD